MPVHPHLLAGRGGGGGREQVAGQPAGRRAPLLRRRARPPGRHDEVSTVGSANSDQQDQHRVDRGEQHDGDAEPQDPAGVVNTDMYMWSSTKTWSRSTDSRSR